MPAAPALTLPAFSAEVPGRLTTRSNRAENAAFAEVLLDAGVLRSEDWCGDVAESIKGGLSRWYDAIPSRSKTANRWRFFDLGFFACDDFDATLGDQFDECDTDEWGLRYNGDPGKPFSGFGFGIGAWTEAVVGSTVRRIEKRLPGAGYALLSLAQSATELMIGCGGPSWAYNFKADYFDHGYATDEEAEESGYPTLTQMERDLPEAARSWARPDDELLEQAAGMRWQGGLREAFRAAIAAQEMLDEGGLSGHEDFIQSWPYLPVRVCWTKGDVVESVFDEYHDMLSNDGGGRDICYFRGFQAGAEGEISPTAAAEAIQRCMRMLDLCDAMLYGLTDKALMTTTTYSPSNDYGPAENDEQLVAVRERLRVGR